jgi:hypothetical protein
MALLCENDAGVRSAFRSSRLSQDRRRIQVREVAKPIRIESNQFCFHDEGPA